MTTVLQKPQQRNTSPKTTNSQETTMEMQRRVEKAPEQSYTKYAGLALIAGAKLFQALEPTLVTIYRILEYVYQYVHPLEYLISIMIGFTMIYFGGTFMTIIAAAEAYRLSSWEETLKQLAILQQNFRAAYKASKEDDQVDEDNDGIADVKQISSQELVQRKLHILMTTIEPMQVSSAAGALYIGFFAVVATLKLQFACAITLGASIGEVMYNQVAPFVNPSLKLIVPEEYHKWVPVINSYFCKSIGVSLAWTLYRVLATFHSALRGIQILKYGFEQALAGSESREMIDTLFFQVVFLMVAVSGIIWQVSHGFGLPFPLNIILLPLRIIETSLMYFANHK